MSKRSFDHGLASHPFTVQAVHPPKGRHLHPFDWIDTPARLLASRPNTAKGLAGGSCSAAHASWAAKDETSSLRRVGWTGAVAFQRAAWQEDVIVTHLARDYRNPSGRRWFRSTAKRCRS
jgi:hypothetical protein